MEIKIMCKINKLFVSLFIATFSNCFASSTMEIENGYRSIHNIKPFSGHQKIEDFSSMNLTNKRSLDLSHRGLKDEDIKNLSQNESSGRIININLSGNPSITSKAIEYISKSLYLGSVRDLPQISDSCGLPATTIYVRIQNTNIKGEQIKKYNTIEGAKKHFNINYSHPVFGSPTSEPVDYGIKFVECDYY